MTRWTESDLDAYTAKRRKKKESPVRYIYPDGGIPSRKSKYRNTPTFVDGMRFDSKWEAQRWHELQLMEKAGAISHLERQISYEIVIPEPKSGDGKICRYVLDFQYWDEERECAVYEDAKGGASTPEFKIKAKLMLAVWGIDVVCVRKDGTRHSGAKRRPPTRKRRAKR